MARAWRWVGERALLRAFPDPVPESNAKALALATRIGERALTEIEELVPGARTLLVVLAHDAEPSSELLGMLDDDPLPVARENRSVHEIAVRYGGEDGPDLADVAASHGMTEDDVIRLHTSATYTVGFIGFSPGFPYLLGMPEALSTPRLGTPRTRIPRGSVGIGGPYTGLYPQETPGGWRLIGRTDAEVFDVRRTPPALLTPGSIVRFERA